MRLTAALVVGILCVGAGHAIAQDAAAEKTIIANERTVNGAFAKGDAAGFKALVSADGWAIDPAMGRGPLADVLKDFAAITKELKISAWDLSESKVLWADANTAIHTYKWTGTGTDHGKPVMSPVWSSTVWSKKDGKWMAIFHQESPAPSAPPK